MRIREIEAENFKLFTKNFHEVNEIEKSDLIVFNGPNGYGKTSAFDIIEFCLTGTIKRIGKYNEELAVKKTEAFDNKILISDETKEAFVKILFDNDGKCIEIKYTYFPAKNKKRGASKENNPHNIFGCFNREIICDGEKIYNQEKFLSEIQFDDIEEIFDKCCFLSQDEHLQFLKAAKKSKAEGLNFLLDVPTEWEKEQEKVNKKIDLLSNKKSKNTSYIPRLKSRQEKEKQKLTELKEKMLESQEDTSITYRRLYTNKNVSWDNENFRIDEITYKNSIKEIDDLIYFSEHKQECGDYHWNLPYQDYIKEYNGDKNISFEEYPLEYAYRFINLLKREKDIEEKYEKEKRYRTIIDCIQKRQFDNLNWDFLQKEELLETEVIDVIKIQLEEVDSLKRTQGIVQEAISTLKESRETLVSKADVIMKEELISSKNCPLCGASYSDREQLNEKIKEETNVLNKISDETTTRIQNIKKKIYEEYLEKVEEKIQIKLENSISDETYADLQNVKKNKAKIFDLEQLLQKIEIEIDNEEKSEESLLPGYNMLITRIKEKLRPVAEEISMQLKEKDFEYYYERFYDKNLELFFEINKEELCEKRKYINGIRHELAGKETMPCIVRNLSDDQAVIVMVDSNLQREEILPSEKAFAYKMKLEAMKRQAGRPRKNSVPVAQEFRGKTSREILGEQVGESQDQICRYIRLTELIPEILEMVDDKKISMRPAVELSYLPKEEQEILYDTMESEACTPSHAQAIKIRKFSAEGRLNEDVLLSIMSEEKPNQVEQWKIPKNRLKKYFPSGTTQQKMEETIIKALELYRKREKSRER